LPRTISGHVRAQLYKFLWGQVVFAVIDSPRAYFEFQFVGCDVVDGGHEGELFFVAVGLFLRRVPRGDKLPGKRLSGIGVILAVVRDGPMDFFLIDAFGSRGGVGFAAFLVSFRTLFK
jgi:hypothetical protein